MKEIHCSNCGRFLCKASGSLEIKCHKCKHVNNLKIVTYTELLTAEAVEPMLKPEV